MFTFEFDENESVGIITLMGKQPNESNFYPLYQKMIAQFNAQKQPEQEEKAGGTD